MMKKNAAFMTRFGVPAWGRSAPFAIRRGKHHLIRSESRVHWKTILLSSGPIGLQRVSSCAALRPLHARNGKAGRFAFTSNTFELKSIEIENDLKTIESSSSKPKRFTSGAPLQRPCPSLRQFHFRKKRSISFFPEVINCLMKRRAKPARGSNAPARSAPPFCSALRLILSSSHAALTADTVSLRARSGGSRRAKSAPPQGVSAGSRFRSTESPLSRPHSPILRKRFCAPAASLGRLICRSARRP